MIMHHRSGVDQSTHYIINKEYFDKKEELLAI